MARTFMNLVGPVVGTTVYAEGNLVGRDVAITLPEVTPTTADVQAMGTLSLPIWQLIENMELSITKIGVDMGLRAMITPKPISLEIRWYHTVTDANGTTKEVGCKAFIYGIANKIPGYSVTPGEAGENECTFTLYNYRLVVDGVDYHNIGRFSGKLVIAGVDLSGGAQYL